MSPFCLPHLTESESGHHLKPGSQTFYGCREKWIWDRGNSPYLSSRKPHFLAPCSLLPHSLWVARRGGSYFSNTNGGLSHTLVGLNRLEFSHCNVLSDTPFPIWLHNYIVKSLQCFVANKFWYRDTVCSSLQLFKGKHVFCECVLLYIDVIWPFVLVMNTLQDENIHLTYVFSLCSHSARFG